MESKHPVYQVLIADSQFLIVEALKFLLARDERYLVKGVINYRLELEMILEKAEINLLIVDYTMIDFRDISDFKDMMQKYPKVHVLILCNSINKTDFMELNKWGFKNIAYKTIDSDEFYSAIDSTVKGKKYYSSELLDLMIEMNMGKQTQEESKMLTSSELEIVKLISQGLTTKEIAQKKNVSFHTVNTHRKNIFRKMGVSNASELVMNAIKFGWIDTIEYYI
jgi:DNA-binding NarL/FixJ family response regulator